MVLCKFWQQGTCRNGNNCRFEHTSVNQGNQSSNRFAPLQNQHNQNNSRNRQGNNSRELPYSLDKDVITVDLSLEKPQWILSAYGPGRQAPAQLFGGPSREQSFEEMRLLHYIGVAAGNPQQAVDQANQMYQAAEQQIQNALENIDGAINYLTNAQNEHPNRLDIVAQCTSGGGQQNPFAKSTSQATSAFGPPNQSTANPFGQSSATHSAFGAPSQSSNPFGAPSQPSQGAFGASSQSTLGGAFGAPSQPNVPAFGAPSQPGAFGRPSVLGQKPNAFGASTTPAFGAPSQLGQSAGAFGQPSALGQKPNPFGAPSAGTGVFGAPSQAGTPNAFGAPQQTTPAFGASSQTGAKPNPFGNPQQASPAFGAPNQLGVKPNPFGPPSSTSFGASNSSLTSTFGSLPQPTAAVNPFGQSTGTLQTNPFGGVGTNAPSNPFGGSPQTKPNPFGGTPASSKPFGAPLKSDAFMAASNQPSSTPNPFGQINGPSSVNGIRGGESGPYLPPVDGTLEVRSYSTRDGTGRLLTFKGKRVQYKEEEPGYIGHDGRWCKIFFPDGPPQGIIKTTTDADDKYDATTEAAYKHLMETGSFPENNVPLLPPLKEWVRWDF